MQYMFANYPTGKRILRIGNDTIEINEGQAEVDELNPAQVTLAEVYGGKPVPIVRIANEEQQPTLLSGADRPQAFVKTIIEQKRILTAALRILDSQLRGVWLGNSK